jgi:hypothetical protein
MLKSRAIFYSSLIAMFMVCLALSFTPFGFPYSGSIDEPRVQRHYVTHTKRTFYDAEGVVTFSDAGFFIKENERNSKRTLDSIFPPEKLLARGLDVQCMTEAFCGFPSYNTSNAFWMLGNDVPDVKPTELTRVASNSKKDSIEMTFEVQGTLLTLLYLSTANDDIKITSTSVGFNQFEWVKGRVARYLKISYGKQLADSFSFNVTIQKPDETSLDCLKVSVVTIDSHFDVSPKSKEFQDLIDKFPDYAFVQSHQADVSSYTFR